MTYNTKTAAEYLHCSESRIAELIAAGHLRAARVGRGYTLKREWLDSFLDEESARQMAEAKAASVRPQAPARRRARATLPDLDLYEARAR
jgi:excisionase family DNA binding protein